ncbi:MAG: hypothetical protein AAF908_09140, partial [Pseudomonadota bacterium]
SLGTSTLSLKVAHSDAGSIESVRFALNGQVERTENVEPYALFGDNQGDYLEGTLGVGSHQVTATFFGQDKAQGGEIDRAEISFEIVDGSDSFLF